MQEALSIILFLCIVRKHSAAKQIGGENLLMLPQTFGVPEEDRLSCSVDSEEAVIRFSKEVQRFCIRKKQDRRSAMILALCVEEIGTNIVKFGIRGQKKRCEILLYASDSGWTLRFRDDCDAFDPVAYLNSFENRDPEQRLGLRTALSLAPEAVYIRSMNINNLRIKLPLRSGRQPDVLKQRRTADDLP